MEKITEPEIRCTSCNSIQQYAKKIQICDLKNCGKELNWNSKSGYPVSHECKYFMEYENVMSKQTTLTDNPPMILDATCSFFHVWPKHATIRMDIRPEVKPDVVGDIRKTDFPDHYFDEIYLDPPHMIRKDNPEYAFAHDKMQIKRRLSGRRTPHAFDRYGTWKTKEEWLEFLNAINVELKRILKPGGKIYFKITSGKDRRIIKREDMDRLTNFDVLEEKITKSKYPGSKNKVHWMTLRGSG